MTMTTSRHAVFTVLLAGLSVHACSTSGLEAPRAGSDASSNGGSSGAASATSSGASSSGGPRSGSSGGSSDSGTSAQDSGAALDAHAGSSDGPDDAAIRDASPAVDRDATTDAARADSGTPAAVAATPPMGWNSWNTFQCSINETLIKAVADAMVSSGMQAAGYQYVNLDDCWMNGRDTSGNLQWDVTKFPSGLPALAAYIHGKGLKFGIYETPNTATCVGIYAGVSRSVAVGSLGHETQDAQSFASWGVDFLKYDLCQGNRSGFPTMRDALRATGRPIVYSINPGNGTNDLYPPTTPGWAVVSIANMWRIAFDINASYGSVTSIIDQDAPFWSFAGPGHWNDADMLEVGKGMSADEDRSHFSMWAMLASPLLAGNDIRSMSAATAAILTNADVIAVDEDPMGAQAQLASTPQPGLQVWSKPLAGTNVRAVALLNRTAAAASMGVQWATIGLSTTAATVRDLWTHTDLGTFSQGYTATSVPTHGVVMLRVAGSL
jgi:alpha-galactosidase